ncbi:MAG: patatin-like phospholipase family protein, partial [Clostridia bacterium]
CVAGTSVGAINGAAIAQGDYDKACVMWEKIDFSNVINLKNESEKHEESSKYQDVLEYIRNIAERKGLDITPLKTLMKKELNEKTIRESTVDFALVTVSLTDMKPVTLFKKDIPEGQLADYVLASASFPAFEREHIDGKTYIDGGLYDNMPVNALADAGYKEIIAVELSPIGIYRKLKHQDVSLLTIKSSESLGGVLEFSPEKAQRNIQMGYLDTKKAFGKYLGRNYYIRKGVISRLTRPLTQKEISLLLEGEGPEALSDTLVRHRILRTLRHYTGKKLGLRNSLIAACEISAEILEVDRLQEYTPDGLARAVLEKYNEIKGDDGDDRSIREHIMNIMVDGEERPGRLMLAGFPKHYICNQFIYLMQKRDSRQKKENRKDGGKQ